MWKSASLPIGIMKNFPSGLKFSQIHTNVVISRCCFAENGQEMFQVLLCTYRANILLIKAFVLQFSRCHCRRGLLKVPVNVVVITGWSD